MVFVAREFNASVGIDCPRNYCQKIQNTAVSCANTSATRDVIISEHHLGGIYSNNDLETESAVFLHPQFDKGEWVI